MGPRAHEVVWGPLLRGKFGAAADEVAMPWFWARVHDRSAGARLPARRLPAPVQGAGRRRSRASAATLRFPRAVEGVAPRRRRPARHRRDGADERSTGSVSTLPTRLTARLVPELPAAWRDRHDWGRALGAHCLILALDRPLTDAYWVNVNDPGFSFMALVEHTNYRDPAEYGGRHLIYLGNYRPMDDPIFATAPRRLLVAVSRRS